MNAEFEEKQYEQQMNIELLCKCDTSNLFAPGQCLENSLGFDVALYSCNKKFWQFFYKGFKKRLLYYYYYLMGYPYIRPEDVRYLEELIRKYLEYVPKIKFNLFIQYKRPECLTRANSSEWKYWNRPYYRYSIDPNQQQLLEKLAQNVDRNSALVIYASPAFHTQQEFWENVKEKTIVDNSNYCEAVNLSGHKKYTYVKGGTYGIAFSEPKEIKSLDLEEAISALREESRYDSNISVIINLASWVENAIKESNYGNYYSMIIESERFPAEFKEYKIIYSLTKLSLFMQITGMKILYGF